MASISSAILASMVCAAMIRHAVTGSVWPIRCTRSIAWVCSALVHESSASTTLEETWRLMPTPAAVSEQTMTWTSGSLTNESMALSRAVRVWSPRIEVDPTPAPGEELLGGVHHVEVLGEEHDLAGAARQLDGVVGGELGLGLADLADHREDVVAAVLDSRALGDLALGHPAYELVVDAVGVRARTRRHGGARARPGSDRHSRWASWRSASRMERPMAPSSSTGRSAIRRAGMSAATSTLRRRTMPMSTTACRAAG